MESEKGHLHPITSVIREIVSIFDKIGFSVAGGPELEDEFHNFDALNVPPDHPARDMQDTFWVKAPKEGLVNNDKLVLRTHTSSVQIRFLESLKDKPRPFKIIVPGKVYRNEATDATHEAQFFQIEGLYVNEKVSMAELKGTLDHFFKEFLGKEAKVRFRASFFGFVEPGVEVDVWWPNPKLKEGGRWLEMFGAGLVHPEVLRASGWDPNKWQGFAFGGGIDRLVMLRYGIDDIRQLYSGDLRLINQF
jgi:phenylalanyl-tRNA synthetase alpha chain